MSTHGRMGRRPLEDHGGSGWGDCLPLGLAIVPSRCRLPADPCPVGRVSSGVAPSASKLKKLKAALDCCVVDVQECSADPHAIAGGPRSWRGSRGRDGREDVQPRVRDTAPPGSLPCSAHVHSGPHFRPGYLCP